MIVKSRLIIAAAVLVGSASMALAQTYRYDQTPDNTLSYGPKASAPAAATANPTQTPVSGGPYYQYDQTPDNTMSYGARQAR